MSAVWTDMPERDVTRDHGAWLVPAPAFLEQKIEARAAMRRVRRARRRADDERLADERAQERRS